MKMNINTFAPFEISQGSPCETDLTPEIRGDGVFMTEKYVIMQDPNTPGNWGIVWDTSGTEGGFRSQDAARKAAIKQDGSEVDAGESCTWSW